MAVEIKQGFVGGGKTYVSLIRMMEHLFSGGVVGCNFHLADDWCVRAAALHPDVKSGRMSQEECAISLYSRCFICGNPASLKELAITGRDLCIGRAEKRRENKVLIVLDEAGLYISPQTYRENMPWLQLMTQSRKLGLDVILIAHDLSFVDTKVRKLCSMQSRIINMSEEIRVPGFGWGWPRGDIYEGIPRPTFIHVVKSTLGGRNHMVFYRYKSTYAALYDTNEIFDYDSLPSVIEPQGAFPVLCDDGLISFSEEDITLNDVKKPERPCRLSMDQWPRRNRIWWDKSGTVVKY